jgi:hypothetical protein
VTLGAISGYPTWSKDGADRRRSRRADPALGAGPDLRVAREVELGHLPAGGRAHLAAVAGDGVAVLWWTASDVDETALGELDRDGRLRIVEEARTDYEGGLAAAATPHSYYVTRKGASTGNQLLWRRFGGGTVAVVPGGLSPQAGVDVARDGTRLVFSTCMERQYVARLRPGAPPTVLSRGEWQDVYPAPIDARTIIVTSNRRGDDQGWALDTAGGAPRAVTPVGAVAARASHDGRTLVYAAAGGRGGLALVPLAGGAPTQLTREPSDAAPTFSHDDRTIVFGRTVAGRSSIYAIPAIGGGVRRLADGGQPATSPIDDRVAFLDAPDADGARAILVTTLAGAHPRPSPASAAPPGSARASRPTAATSSPSAASRRSSSSPSTAARRRASSGPPPPTPSSPSTTCPTATATSPPSPTTPATSGSPRGSSDRDRILPCNHSDPLPYFAMLCLEKGHFPGA